MQIKEVKLTHFRNFSSLNLSFAPGLNVVIGQNGVGKTNIIEAIHYLSLARSFRTNDDKNLIQHGFSEAKVNATLTDGRRNYLLEINITSEGKRVRVNEVAIARLSRLAELVNVIIFEPKDVNFFNASPGTRRKFMDVSLTKSKNQYLGALSNYEKLLKERNASLKKERIDWLEIEVLTEQMIDYAEAIINYRSSFINKLNQVIPKIMNELDPKLAAITLEYHPFIKPGPQFKKEARLAFKKAKQNDIKYRATSIGVQKEDFKTLLKGEDISVFASQGQKRVIALAVALSPYFLAKNAKERPIVVLDDALSELDQKHQNSLVQFLKKLEQAFITTTTFPFMGDELYEVKTNQEVIKRRFV